MRFDKSDRYLANLDEMMERLGIDPAEATEEQFAYAMASVLRACQLCPAGDVCSDWLARAPAAVHRAPAFCPNAGRLEDLAIEQAVVGHKHTIH